MSLRQGSRFRARPIDINKKVPLYQADSLEEFEDEITVSRNLPQITTGMLQEDEQELFSGIEFDNDKDDSTVQSAPMIDLKIIEIPIPRWNLVVPPPLSFTFKKPLSYIRAKIPIVENDDSEQGNIEYDLESDDERFLEETKKLGYNISELAFERCIDRLEKETAHLRDIKDSSDVFATPGCVELSSSSEDNYSQNTKNKESNIRLRPMELQSIYEYWLKKRERRQKALIRRFVEPPEMDDPSPYVAFRPHHKTFSRSRRRNDLCSYRKLQEISTGLKKLQLLLELVRRRERLKELYFVNRSKINEMRVLEIKETIESMKRNGTGNDRDSSFDFSNEMKLKRKFSEAVLDETDEDEDEDEDGYDSDISVDIKSVRYKENDRLFINNHKKQKILSEGQSYSHHPFSTFARVGRGGRILLNRQFLLNSQQPINPVIPLSRLKTSLTNTFQQLETCKNENIHDHFKYLLTKEIFAGSYPDS